jgi:pyridoxamine 5'-phosphate oxidase
MKNKVNQEFTSNQLDDVNLTQTPFELFNKWFKKESEVNPFYACSMTLSTCGNDNMPSARVVLLRDYSEEGFVFFTNYQSRKGKSIEENPNVALSFFYTAAERQILIQGTVKKIEPDISDAYFETRSRNSQISTYVSKQSQKVFSRSVLEEEFEQKKASFGDNPIERPQHWGGYIVDPTSIEFWQGREGRLHDRIVFEKTESNIWTNFRLYP